METPDVDVVSVLVRTTAGVARVGLPVGLCATPLMKAASRICNKLWWRCYAPQAGLARRNGDGGGGVACGTAVVTANFFLQY